MRQCPRCNVPFETQRRTFAEIDTCPQCGGTFLDPGEGVTALGHRDDLRAVVDRGDAMLVGPSQLGCPTGHGTLTIYRFGGAERTVEVDVCNVCSGAFFDAGETDIIADIQARAGEETRSSFASPPGSKQDAAIEAARREGGRSAFSSFFSSLAVGITGALAKGGGRHHHHHHHHHHKGGGGSDKK